MDVTAEHVQYLRDNQHKDLERIWRGFSDKFQLSASSSWFRWFEKSLDSLENDPNYISWVQEMRVCLHSDLCDDWRKRNLHPRRSRLEGVLWRAAGQEATGAVTDAQTLIQHARGAVANNAQGELAILVTGRSPARSPATATRSATAATRSATAATGSSTAATSKQLTDCKEINCLYHLCSCLDSFQKVTAFIIASK